MPLYNKPRSEQMFYRDRPGLARRAEEFDQARESKAVADRAVREQLRRQYSAAHRNSCPTFESHRIPFESCGTCCAAFEQAVATRTGR